MNVSRYLRYNRVSSEKIVDVTPSGGWMQKFTRDVESSYVGNNNNDDEEDEDNKGGEKGDGGHEREDYQVKATSGVQNASHAG